MLKFSDQQELQNTRTKLTLKGSKLIKPPPPVNQQKLNYSQGINLAILLVLWDILLSEYFLKLTINDNNTCELHL